LFDLITQIIPKAIRMVTNPVSTLVPLRRGVMVYVPRTPKRINKDLARGVRPLCGSTLTAVARLEGMLDPTIKEDARTDRDTDCGAVTACGIGTL
jgi:hypothetical protein